MFQGFSFCWFSDPFFSNRSCTGRKRVCGSYHIILIRLYNLETICPVSQSNQHLSLDAAADIGGTHKRLVLHSDHKGRTAQVNILVCSTDQTSPPPTTSWPSWTLKVPATYHYNKRNCYHEDNWWVEKSTMFRVLGSECRGQEAEP